MSYGTVSIDEICFGGDPLPMALLEGYACNQTFADLGKLVEEVGIVDMMPWLVDRA
jgi:hypothetical protein